MRKSKSGSPARKQKRAEEAAEKSATKDRAGGPLLKQYSKSLDMQSKQIAELQQAVRVLQTNFARMVEAQQSNHQQLILAFNMTDAHLWVLKQVQRDHFTGKLKLSGLGEIDYTHYYQAFNAHQEEQRRLAEEVKKAQAEQQEPSEVTDAPTEFGGDYGETQETSPASEGAEESSGGEDNGREPAEDPMPPMSLPGVAHPGRPG